MSETTNVGRVGSLLLALLFLAVTAIGSVGVIFLIRSENKQQDEAKIASEVMKRQSDTKKALADAAAKKPAIYPLPDKITSSDKVASLKVEDLHVGNGLEAKPTDTVTAYYEGWLLKDGSVFDSAYQRGSATSFPLSQVIPGWTQGLTGMKVGGQRRLTIPAALGYGEKGSPPKIGPNEDLVFVVELMHIEPTK